MNPARANPASASRQLSAIASSFGSHNAATHPRAKSPALPFPWGPVQDDLPTCEPHYRVSPLRLHLRETIGPDTALSHFTLNCSSAAPRTRRPFRASEFHFSGCAVPHRATSPEIHDAVANGLLLRINVGSCSQCRGAGDVARHNEGAAYRIEFPSPKKFAPKPGSGRVSRSDACTCPESASRPVLMRNRTENLKENVKPVRA